MMLAVAVALAFQFPLNNLWHGTTYEISPHVAADDAVMAQVPDGATVTTTLGLLAPLAAARTRSGSATPATRSPSTSSSTASNSGYSPAPANVPAFISQLYPKTGDVQIFARDHV